MLGVGAVRSMRVRSWAGAVVLGLVLAAGVAVPATADPPPLDWHPLAGYPKTVDGLTITWQTASSPESPFGGGALLDPVPVVQLEVVNDDDVARTIGFGTDFATKGAVDRLWTSAAWGAFADTIGSSTDAFWVTLSPGEALSTSDAQAATWHDPLPMWTGHTLRVFGLSGPPSDVTPPTVTTLDDLIVPGRFVGANMSPADLNNPSEFIGKQAIVSTTGGDPQLFPGVTASVTASGLTAGESLDLWIAPDLDYFYFSLIGGVLPAGARQVGSGVVGTDGTLAATFTLPADVAYGGYQLAAGVRGERYWPAGSYGDFTVGPPPAPQSVTTTPGQPASIDIGSTTVGVGFSASASGGVTTVVATTTGPVASGFVMPGDPPLYLHLSSTVSFTGSVPVCVDYDTGTLPGGPFRLYHFDTALGRWVDITTSSVLGRVCGLTSSFSPFAVGAPMLDFSGFFDPVDMTGPNVAKAGQAIPVKFSLGGDQGLGVVTAARFVVEGTVLNPTGEVLDAVTAGRSGLSYDRATGQYTYIWKTDKTWALKSGRFLLTLSDGSEHSFAVSFRK